MTSLINKKYTLKYPIGKDTVKYFYDGKYQIFSNVDKTLCIVNIAEQNTCIEKKIYKYQVNGDKIYIVGAIGYTILNYKTDYLKQLLTFKGYDKGEIEQYKSFEQQVNKAYYGNRWIIVKSYKDFSEEERKVFNRMLSN